MTDDEMAGWHHRLNGHEFEQPPGVGDGQGSLACCSPWGHKEWDRTEGLNNSNNVAAAARSLQSCRTLCDPTDGSPPGSPVHGIFQARVLEWGAIAFSSNNVKDTK